MDRPAMITSDITINPTPIHVSHENHSSTDVNEIRLTMVSLLSSGGPLAVANVGC
jgi:hypothetical protein